eukprot:TRINITY_DN585_c0_g1_i3.p1 TRINITY_DN585_c0_g1~~TRINITY_DN585_c0_g1_i3.p1  ORF type:complete len:817 (+),score=178.10 TRINITY_DN585_c0_g1_i3:76-2526(+)
MAIFTRKSLNVDNSKVLYKILFASDERLQKKRKKNIYGWNLKDLGLETPSEIRELLEIRIEKFALDPLISIAIETCNCELSVEEPRRREVQEVLIKFMMGNHHYVIGSERNEKIVSKRSASVDDSESSDSESSDDDETDTESEEESENAENEEWDLENGVQEPLSEDYSATWDANKRGIKKCREVLSCAIQNSHWNDCYQMVLRKPKLLTCYSPYVPVVEALQLANVPLKVIKLLDSPDVDWNKLYSRKSLSILFLINPQSCVDVLEYVLTNHLESMEKFARDTHVFENWLDRGFAAENLTCLLKHLDRTKTHGDFYEAIHVLTNKKKRTPLQTRTKVIENVLPLLQNDNEEARKLKIRCCTKFTELDVGSGGFIERVLQQLDLEDLLCIESRYNSGSYHRSNSGNMLIEATRNRTHGWIKGILQRFIDLEYQFDSDRLGAIIVHLAATIAKLPQVLRARVVKTIISIWGEKTFSIRSSDPGQCLLGVFMNAGVDCSPLLKFIDKKKISLDKESATEVLFYDLQTSPSMTSEDVIKCIKTMPEGILETVRVSDESTTLMAVIHENTPVETLKWMIEQVSEEYALRVGNEGSILTRALRVSNKPIATFLMSKFPQLIPLVDGKGKNNLDHLVARTWNAGPVQKQLMTMLIELLPSSALQPTSKYLQSLSYSYEPFAYFVKEMHGFIDKDEFFMLVNSSISSYPHKMFVAKEYVFDMCLKKEIPHQERLEYMEKEFKYMFSYKFIDSFIGREGVSFSKPKVSDFIENQLPYTLAQLISIVGCQDYVDHEYALYNAEGCVQDALVWMTLPYEMTPSLLK